jgi:large subunit ribosomal protein L21
VERSGQKGGQIELPGPLPPEGEQVLVGSPYLANVKVVGEILDQRRAKKIIVFKMKRRKGYHKRQGHRQSFTTLRIKEITVQ